MRKIFNHATKHTVSDGSSWVWNDSENLNQKVLELQNFRQQPAKQHGRSTHVHQVGGMPKGAVQNIDTTTGEWFWLMVGNNFAKSDKISTGKSRFLPVGAILVLI